MTEQYKHEALAATVKRNLMLAPLYYASDEIYFAKTGSQVRVSMMAEEDRKKRGAVPLSVTASLSEWQALFDEVPKLAQKLSMIDMTQSRFFHINGVEYCEGESFTICAPEFGTIAASATIQEYSYGTVFGLHFGFIQTPLTCQSLIRPGTNAALTFYTNGDGYSNLILTYCCPCPYNVHSHSLEWANPIIGSSTIKADKLGKFFNQPHNHPVVEEFRHLKPKPLPPEIPVNMHHRTGQLSIF